MPQTTTMLDAQIKDDELVHFYFRRWGIELHLREIKTSLHITCCAA